MPVETRSNMWPPVDALLRRKIDPFVDVDSIVKSALGLVVPMPTLPLKTFVPVVVKLPTTVEEAWETKPAVCVSSPVIPRVDPKSPAPVTVKAPTLVDDACERKPEPKFCSPVHVLLLLRSVEDAAVSVIEEPLVKGVPLIVPSVPER